MHKHYLKGLDTLRFFAAFFVIIAHGQLSVIKLGVEQYRYLPFFNKHGDAVEFFFTLSGFLITYLLQKEINRTRTVSVKSFYLRRVFRIWPVYFLIVAIGFLFLGILYPHFSGQHFFEFSVLHGILLFVCFLPNLAAAFYPTGLMHPLWSIGVEEQYYLFWAPLVKLFRNNLLRLALVFLVITATWYIFLTTHRNNFSAGMYDFLSSQKFYAMATGGLFGLILCNYPEQYKKTFLAGKPAQLIVLAIVIYYYLVGYPVMTGPGTPFLLSFLYGLLILNTCVLEKPLLSFENRVFGYLGKISYGLYMFHMLIDYLLRYVAVVLHFNRLPAPVLLITYELCLLGGSILIASLSYKYFESYFLRLKERYA